MDRERLEEIIDRTAKEFGRAVGRQLRTALLGILDDLETEELDEEMEMALAYRLESMAEKPRPRKRKPPAYPKCAYPGCGKNRFVRGKGFCGEHWKMWKKGEIKAAEYYREGK